MIYSNLTAEQLVPLRDALVELMFFVNKWEYSHIPVFYHYLGFMKNNIEICICVHEDWGDGLRELNRLLARDWNRANDKYVGIPSCELFVESRSELCLQYLGLLNEVGSYFIPYVNVE